MMHNKKHYIKSILIPCFFFSAVTGLATGALIFVFRIASSLAVKLSAQMYGFVREQPTLLPLLVLAVTAVGAVAAFILNHTKNCRGGGIPTSVAIIRGLIEFRWLKSVFYLFASALLSFIGGVPLGTEGPSVQMGTALGRGTVRIFGKKHKAWDRYIMTGGACGGFAAATGAALTGILFSVEEAHRRFSPLIFMTAAMTVTFSTAAMHSLCDIAGISPYMFELELDSALPLKYIWIAAIIGIACGFFAVAFTKLYLFIGDFLSRTLKRIPFSVKVISVFALVSLLGFLSDGFIGSGHDIIHTVMDGYGIWYMLLIFLCVRSLMLMLANRVGVSGGIFLPSLAVGALIGALISKLAVLLGVLPREYFAIAVIIGMSAFLAASARTPITAVCFAFEALCGIHNSLHIVAGVTLAYLVIELCDVTSLHDAVINKKLESFNDGKASTVVDIYVTVMPESFAVGKEVRDVLWPHTCTVLSLERHQTQLCREADQMCEGDLLHIHYQTYETDTTYEAIEAIVGYQPESPRMSQQTVDENSVIVPEV